MHQVLNKDLVVHVSELPLLRVVVVDLRVADVLLVLRELLEQDERAVVISVDDRELECREPWQRRK